MFILKDKSIKTIVELQYTVFIELLSHKLVENLIFTSRYL